MSLCVFIAGKAAACMAGLLFSLSWTHSIEKTQWIEHWQIQGQQLALRETFVKGSGAGIDPPTNAVLRNGWYQWKPLQAMKLDSLSLANSELTPDNWKLCVLDTLSHETIQCIDFSEFENHGVESFTVRATTCTSP